MHFGALLMMSPILAKMGSELAEPKASQVEVPQDPLHPHGELSGLGVESSSWVGKFLFGLSQGIDLVMS
jgi:hypothetical protein